MSKEMIITREETFAPVVGLYEFGTEEEAASLPNACREAGESQRRYGRCEPQPSECLREPIWWSKGEWIWREGGYRGVFGGQVDAY